MVQHVSAAPMRIPEVVALLTERQIEVVQLVARGLSNKEIARALGISTRTVEDHVSNARKRLGKGNRAHLAAWAATRWAGEDTEKEPLAGSTR